MAKTSRLADRPKPPTLDEQFEDTATADKSDVVFKIGKDCLDALENVETAESLSDGCQPTSKTLTSSVSSKQVKKSYSNVLQFLTLYSELKNAPSELEEKYAKLKSLRAEMTTSIDELKALSQELGPANSPSKSSPNKTGSSKPPADSKGKVKAKKKK